MPPGALLIVDAPVDETFGSPVTVVAEVGPEAEVEDAGTGEDTGDKASELLDKTPGGSALARTRPSFAILVFPLLRIPDSY